MLYLALKENIENMLQWKHFGLYLERILNKIWLNFHIEIMISAAHMLGGSGHDPRENFEMIDAIWCVLLYLLIKFYHKKGPL